MNRAMIGMLAAALFFIPQLAFAVREIRSEKDLPAPTQQRYAQQRQKDQERSRDPKTLTLEERVARLEKLLGS